MISVRDRAQKKIVLLYRSLLICFAVLGLIIAVGTVYGVCFRAGVPEPERIDVPRDTGEGQVFTGIGQIRIPTADPQPGMVILFVSFIYYPDDRAFTEELVLRVRNFRDIITDYIGSYQAAELRKLDDESIKTELLRRFNAILRLGQIETVYFSDFMIIG